MSIFIKPANTALFREFLAYGWSMPEGDYVWGEGPRSTLHIPLPCSKTLSLKIKFHAYRGGNRTAKFHLFVNGLNCGLFSCSDYVGELELKQIVNSLAPECGVYIDFYHIDPLSPLIAGESSDPRRLNIAVAALELDFADESEPLPDVGGLAINALTMSDATRLNDALANTLHLRNKILAESGAEKLGQIIEGYVFGVGGNADDRLICRRTILESLHSIGFFQDPFEHGRLRKEVIAQFCPHVLQYVLDEKSSFDEPNEVILPRQPNALYDPAFAAPWRDPPTWFGRTEIPDEIIFSSAVADLVVDGRRFAVITSDGRAGFTHCNHADLSSISIPPVVSEWDGHLVLVMDQFDGTNISHFLFDSVVRLLHWCERHPDKTESAAFVFGGIPAEFHRLVLKAVAAKTGLQPKQIWFPSKRLRVRARLNLYWFQSTLIPQHPANIVRRESAAKLKDLGRNVSASIASTADAGERIYISRLDAHGRRPCNEREIVELLKSKGFAILSMSQLSWEDQISIVSKARYVVAPHGMGLTHLAFNSLQPRVIEMFNEARYSDAYALLARGYGNDYVRLIGRQTNEHNRDFMVDIEELAVVV